MQVVRPNDVYYDVALGNFFQHQTRAPMGAEFWKEWAPFKDFFPRVPIGEKVKRCKHCPQPALPDGRQECGVCRKSRLTKAKKAQAFRLALPRCETPDCDFPARFRHEEGSTVRISSYCAKCEYDHDQQVAAANKIEQLDMAQTVEDLKEWIRKYAL